MKAAALILDRPYASHQTWGVMALGSLLFAALTAAGAAVSIPLPFSPVPITLQTLAVILAGAVLGPVWGPISMLTYITAGVSGLPVFAGGAAGPQVLFGPTGGYLMGFVLGAWASGLVVRPGSSWPRLLLGLLAAHTAIFVMGLAQLKIYTGNSIPVALQLGLWPFLPGMVLKTIAGAVLARSKRVGWFRN